MNQINPYLSGGLNVFETDCMANTLLIKKVQLNGEQKDILIEGNRFKRITEHIDCASAKVIDGSNMLITPPFYNGHTHAAMSLLRGYADDMELFCWLNNHIWPMEAKFTPQDVYVGSRLAILEMIKSGTCFFLDMYFNAEQTLRAVEEMGIRANLSCTFMDNPDPDVIEGKFKYAEQMLSMATERVSISVGPHAIYTVGQELFTRCSNFARERDIVLHTHLAETQKEFDDCIKEHGCTPTEWIDSMGALTPNTFLAHGVYLTDHDLEIIYNRGAVIVTNPCSNMKLCSGRLRFQPIVDAGCKLLIGTDGCSSNNNLDMMEEMKFTSLLAKSCYGTECAPAPLLFNMATKEGAQAFHIDAGEIKEGKLADALLINLNHTKLVPNYHTESNLVYASDSSCIDTMICNGQIVMQGRKVKDEEEIIESARRTCFDLCKR